MFPTKSSWKIQRPTFSRKTFRYICLIVAILYFLYFLHLQWYILDNQTTVVLFSNETTSVRTYTVYDKSVFKKVSQVHRVRNLLERFENIFNEVKSNWRLLNDSLIYQVHEQHLNGEELLIRLYCDKYFSLLGERISCVQKLRSFFFITYYESMNEWYNKQFNCYLNIMRSRGSLHQSRIFYQFLQILLKRYSTYNSLRSRTAIFPITNSKFLLLTRLIQKSRNLFERYSTKFPWITSENTNEITCEFDANWRFIHKVRNNIVLNISQFDMFSVRYSSIFVNRNPTQTFFFPKKCEYFTLFYKELKYEYKLSQKFGEYEDINGFPHTTDNIYIICQRITKNIRSGKSFTSYLFLTQTIHTSITLNSQFQTKGNGLCLRNHLNCHDNDQAKTFCPLSNYPNLNLMEHRKVRRKEIPDILVISVKHLSKEIFQNFVQNSREYLLKKMKLIEFSDFYWNSLDETSFYSTSTQFNLPLLSGLLVEHVSRFNDILTSLEKTNKFLWNGMEFEREQFYLDNLQWIWRVHNNEFVTAYGDDGSPTMMINKRINSLLFSDLGLFKLRPTNHFYHMVNWMNSFHIFDTNFSLEYLRGIVNNEKNYVTYKNMEIFKLPFINHMCYGFKKNVFQKLFDWVKDLYVTYDRTFFDVEQQDEAFNKHRARFLVTILFNNLWEAFMSTFSSRKHPPTNSNGSSVHYDNFYTYIPSSNNYNPNKKRKAKLTFIHFQSLANIILSKRNFGIFDFEFKKLLDQLKMQKKNRLRNTILILVGDGNHYDERVDTILHGKKKKNPLLAIGLGETVRRNFPNLEKQLKLNRNKRVSTIDIYRTIIELVDELKETGNKRKDFTEKWIKYYHQLYHMNGFEGDNSLIKQSLKCFNNSVSLFSSFSGNRTCDDICSKSIIHSHSCSYHEGTMKMLFDSSASDVPFDSSQYRWDTKLSVENIDIMDELNIYSIHQSHEKFGWKFIKNILHFSNKLSMFLEEVLEQYITDDDTRAFCKNLKIVSLIHVQYLRKHNNYLLIDVDLEPSPRLLRLVLKSNFRNSIDILKTNTFDDVTLVNIMNGGRTLPDHSWCLKSYDMFQRDLCYCE